MLLQRLVEYAKQHTTTQPFHRRREFRWQLALYSSKRQPELVSLIAPDDQGRQRGRFELTPAVTRTSDVSPQMGADQIQYVLGWGDDSTKNSRVRQCHDEFVKLIDKWAHSGTASDHAARVVRDFYANGGVDSLESPEDPYSAKQNVLITVDEVPIIEQESLHRFWEREVEERKGTGHEGLCLVCGYHAPLAKTSPNQLARHLVPGADKELALISVNKRVFGYGLTDGLSHTPICLGCADLVTTALTYLLDSEHVVRLPQQDSAMAWWTLGEPDDDFLSAMSTRPNADSVTRLISRMHNGQLGAAGKRAEEFSGDRFCSVTLGGNSSRIVIRDWIDRPLEEAMTNLARWYADILVTSRWEAGTVPSGYWSLVIASGKWLPGTGNEPGRYADPTLARSQQRPGDRAPQRPVHIQRDLLNSCLRGSPVPTSVLHHVLGRVAADGHLDVPRAALLRLALRRHPSKEVHMSPGLNEELTDTQYVSGRIFAHLEQIQYHASDGQLNATFGDRFLSSAIGNPNPAILAGEKLATSWLAKLRRREDTKGKAYALEQKLSELRKLIETEHSTTGYLSPDQQAMFLLGYHHQKAHDMDQARKHKAEKDSGSESDTEN
ncbi:type I-C CRISPR-associated protein Cas8c/Csd1 [Actinopolyspora saharensis]|uniref:CRISPR-associated protein Csd1 n=1 Tax=Actinopolyspora saharensis TaxID=995062 RepID=A0A1H1DM60_9ACTN|nr:type I-C CRISPR-associated protein Cas8c/Csd1 [Actinopolyspora saharensis]SDQ77537.1 CRISPR-associated protein Csd1 [Actinopolyspora saharensis]